MTLLAAIKLAYKRLFPKANLGNMPRSRSTSVEPCPYGYMPGDALFGPIVDAYYAAPEPRRVRAAGNAGGVRQIEEGKAGY